MSAIWYECGALSMRCFMHLDEYGAVNLEGRSTWERAEALISIAHPDFKEGLIKAAETQKTWIRSNKR